MDIRRKEKKAKSKVVKKEHRWKAAVVTLSDKGYAGDREDKSGPLLYSMLEEAGYEVTTPIVVTNSDEFNDVEMKAEGQVTVGVELLELS